MSNRTQRRPLGQRTKPMSERSVSKRRVIQDKLDNKKVDEEIDISNQIKLEEDRIRLQKELRLRIKELAKLREAYSKEFNKWTKKCQHLGEKFESIQNVDETIFQLLQNANSVNDDCIKQNNDLNEKLTELYKSIPKKEPSKSLKCRLKPERSNVNRANGNLTKLEKQQTHLQKQLGKVKNQLTDLSLDKSKRHKLKRQRDELSSQITTTNEYVEEAREDYNEKDKNYNDKAKSFSKDSQQNQIKSLQTMKDILHKFIHTLTIESSSSNSTTHNIKSSKKHFQSREKNRSSSSSTDEDEPYYSVD